ncbi:MAG: glutamine--tRNA ligase [Weeping tea tree witches'-broom phytoplasma]|uniref:glutamine--tRNA ligase n=1 Tax=Candidatus Phytoplasma melaleucae TaxID=2982630 RepID=UPI00293AB218|nr:glutamine--tRNA ligase [Weeping tea tree witches'-broom phytoplasma]
MLESNFIKTIMQKDLKEQKYQEIITRFPPEPNGFLHLGHARAIIINFELAKLFGGKTYLRYDDTNPNNEHQDYVNAILEDIRWLGYEPDKIFFASDYFDIFYQKAVLLIKKNKAFVDDLNSEELKKYRGNLTEPGINSPYRNRTIKENLELFQQMKEGFFKEGEKVLRAKINMASPNINLRDPVLYRILDAYTLKKKHYYIYPSYDFAHPLEDAIEKITHSLCSLEFEDHRPLYNWVIQMTEMQHTPTQIEFGRLNITNTFLSKRHLKFLVDSGLVQGWDDPRMPTLRGVKKRGYTSDAIKEFVFQSGISKNNNYVDKKMLDACLRNDLQKKSKKIIAIIDPLKVTITNYPKNKMEFAEVPYNENDPLNFRKLFFSGNIYIEKSDFQLEKLNTKSRKLFLNGEVRLLNFYFIKAYDVIRDDKGEIIEILATYDPQTKSGSGFNKRKPNGNIHFLTKEKSKKAIFNFYKPLFLDNQKIDHKNIKVCFNKDSWKKKNGLIEENINSQINYEYFQFIRNGYFHVAFQKNNLIYFNEIIALKSYI